MNSKRKKLSRERLRGRKRGYKETGLLVHVSTHTIYFQVCVDHVGNLGFTGT